MPELLTPEQRVLLTEKLITAIGTTAALRAWVQAYFPAALPRLTETPLENLLPEIMVWANAEDGMQTLLQRFADYPPHQDIPPMIFLASNGSIKSRNRTQRGLPEVSADRTWFVADRPFVNRGDLRRHLRELNDSAGAKAVLIIEGKDGTGKTFALSMARGFGPAQVQPSIDVDDFARAGAQLKAREFAILIAGGDDEGCPPVDDTKEDQAVPGLMFWLVKKLQGRNVWIIVDHCQRRVLTPAARALIRELAIKLRKGELPKTKLILADFDTNELPEEWRKSVRRDFATLPDETHVKEWCLDLATAAKRKHSDDAPAKWAQEVFAALAGQSLEDGSWQAELETRLQEAVDRILACEERP